MIVQIDFLNKLKDFGLNSYESKLWIALLSRGVSTAGELSDISNVPRSRAYDVLESLEKKGFIVVKVGKPIKYLAVPPAEVIERVKKKVEEEAVQRNEVLSQLKDSDVLGELNSLHTEGIKLIDPTDRSGAFRGRAKSYEHLITMIKNAQKSITIMTTKDGAERKISVLSNYCKKAARNGVAIKIFVPAATSKDVIDEFSHFAAVKQYKNDDTRFCIVDGKELFLFLTDDQKVHKSYDCAVWIEAPYFVNYFNTLFENEWKGSK
ncbi:MAG: helix-turn-helix domain-containing protein [Nanoarchaeota archaeon]|nr:helix-turn-helix domain-containing protein [Nanoarchaeota archaeon]